MKVMKKRLRDRSVFQGWIAETAILIATAAASSDFVGSMRHLWLPIVVGFFAAIGWHAKSTSYRTPKGTK